MFSAQDRVIGLDPQLEALGFGRVVGQEKLTGGMINTTVRVRTSRHRAFVVKHRAGVPEDLYLREAEGLGVLREAGVRVPDVIAVTSGYLVLEDLDDPTRAGSPGPPREPDWVDLGHRIAHMHLVRNDRFGFATDNYLGLLPQANPWTADGYDFYLRHRLEPLLENEVLLRVAPVDVIEGSVALAGRIREIVLSQPPSLLHGDLWVIPQPGRLEGNIVLDRDGVPALIDPAAHYGWAEADLGAMSVWKATFPAAFWDAYREVNPLEDGWEERLPFFHLHEGLAVLGTAEVAVEGHDFAVRLLRSVIARFS